MANINDLINLAKADGGKFFVIDETGEPSLVIMPIEQYEALLLRSGEVESLDVETINKEITQAQIAPEENLYTEDFKKTESVYKNPNTFLNNGIRRQPDLRAEVIDPSFDFEMPKMDDDF